MSAKNNQDINRVCDEYVVSKQARDIDSFIDSLAVRDPEALKVQLYETIKFLFMWLNAIITFSEKDKESVRC